MVASVAVKKCLRQTSKAGPHKVYTDKDRYSIGKHASCHGVIMNVSPKKKLANKMLGRPTLLGQNHDVLVQKFLRATRYKGGVMNMQTVLATAKALVKRYPLLEKENLILGAPYAKSLFCRMDFVLRRKTTAKVLVPEGALKEAELKFHHQIVNYVEKYQIPPSLIINFDQTPKYVQISSNTMEKKDKKRSTLWNR